jgi:hypothetical protein
MRKTLRNHNPKTLEPTALSSSALLTIEKALEVATTRVIDQMCVWPEQWQGQPLLEYMFGAETVAACKAAFIQTNERYHHSYSSFTYDLPVIHWILASDSESFNTLGLLAPCDLDYVKVPPEVEAYLTTVNKILYDYAQVNYVMCWFNRNANKQTFRAYCPWINSLLGPEYQISDSLRGIKEPAHLGPMLPMIRHVATVMATALLAPATCSRPALPCFTFLSKPYNLKTDTGTIGVGRYRLTPK